MWPSAFRLYFLFYYYKSTVAGANEAKPSQLFCRIRQDLLKQLTANTHSIFRLRSLTKIDLYLVKDSNADQNIKSENILLLSCLRTERKKSEHTVHVRWRRGGWVKARDHDVLWQALICYVGNGWVGACAQEHFGIKQLNGLSPDTQNSKDYAWAFLPFLLAPFSPWFPPFIHLFIHP